MEIHFINAGTSEAPHVSKRVRVAIVGANGYSGEELCRILAHHPGVEIVCATSRQHAGKRLAEVMPRLLGVQGLESTVFEDSTLEVLHDCGAEFFFLALPHGLATEFAEPLIKMGKRVIDLSADFRLRSPALYEAFYDAVHPAPGLLSKAVYGLPELYRSSIRNAQLVASAGCYPTSILLPLCPLLRRGVICSDGITVASASGVSGAGRKAEVPLLFAECNESLRTYGVPKHRHLSEIEQELAVAAGSDVTITFVPHLAPMTRGIHTTIFAEPSSGVHKDDIERSLVEAYADEPFVRLVGELPNTRNVVGTNYCDIAVRFDTRSNRVILLSVEDNLVKGASGQAVQNFNLMAGFDEATGLCS